MSVQDCAAHIRTFKAKYNSSIGGTPVDFYPIGIEYGIEGEHQEDFNFYVKKLVRELNGARLISQYKLYCSYVIYFDDLFILLELKVDLMTNQIIICFDYSKFEETLKVPNY